MPEIDSDATTQYPPQRIRLPHALSPFRLGQYRLLAGALTLSLLGAGMWIVAVVWQVIALGGGPAELSLVATGNAIGMLVAVLFGGVLADRVPQRNILLTVEAVKTVFITATASLALSGLLELWHLVAVTCVLGLADGFFYPAYSALLPAILPAGELLAANGVEGMLRPTIMQAAGPALASAAIAALNPGLAFALVAGAQALAVTGLVLIRTTPVRREIGEPQHPLVALGTDLREGFIYMWRTPWLLGTLLYACLLILVIMGPIEVLLPFAVRDQTGGGPAAFALALAAFGIGGAIGSLVVASMKLPRRYLTIMNLLWGAGCLPLVVIGITSQLWLMVIALFIVGFTFSAATVIWGTLLQRRVPPSLLGRVSSLDFFVSLTLMPVSMALAGPVGEAIGLTPAFFVAGAVPVVLAVATILLFRLPRDEIQHPLDADPDAPPVASEEVGEDQAPLPEPGPRPE
ncbi:MFS transporter [Mycetocola manganoxydans]|uniref:MFS transporter n=1 Tax=Mycetocola manganoxydans TaxID=699879 RepID=A0A3L6ZPD5_9MICO|nr:MFS transporter [Mycetocola manganoxydans]RLP69793.1 MFS transporter [Mycetocola manganoxydans]GHD50045.1 putative transporter [Mycetocola manganoxydans]